MFIDTHTHPYLEQFENPVAVVDKAIEAGVGLMILPNVDSASLQPLRALHLNRPTATRTAIGLHPTEVKSGPVEPQLDFVRKNISTLPGLVAVGEIGIDLYWDKTLVDNQMLAFEAQMQIARECGLPVIIHCREAFDETLEVIQSFKEKPPMVFHSFGGTEKDVDRIRRICDPMFGINGIVTFKNSGLRNVLPHIGLERIILETDAPYLAPVPFRGKRNEPAFLPYIAAHVAESLQQENSEIENATTANAKKLFSL